VRSTASLVPVLVGLAVAVAAACSMESGQESMARAWVGTARGTIDETTLDQYTAQMPSGIQTAIERDGANRMLVWTFTDGSRVTATFRPRGGEGSGAGLVLYMIDVDD
jgi:YD repeat-containing protein